MNVRRWPIPDSLEQTLLGAGPAGWVILAGIYQVAWLIRDVQR